MKYHESDIKDTELATYQTLDKDYGRTKFVGGGYGSLDQDEYNALEDLVK